MSSTRSVARSWGDGVSASEAECGLRLEANWMGAMEVGFLGFFGLFVTARSWGVGVR